eukprot:CAMPEP_0177767002 /NCGR_PEP_ID=MMETSP0491_2-20121128/8835_1 /TAXON_ID=63592 /ORGANISM="Tetraselmis chuii, Strain PLY429" /LENGTH=366 /DNA_ID=CAMNT_0019283473 /DNA_START=216 /DNA_END=1316 /DNA_ORIENTATION=+
MLCTTSSVLLAPRVATTRPTVRTARFPTASGWSSKLNPLRGPPAPATLSGAVRATPRRASAAQRSVVRCAAEGTSTSRREGTVSWSAATVVENRAESADGVVRTLVLSVEDDVPYLDGRKRKHVQQRTRWIDNYKQPGQKVSLRFPGADKPLKTTAVASSPYQTHAKSADFAAGIIEVLVEHGEGEVDEKLADLAPGAELQVSDIAGLGFASVFDKDVGLAHTLEEGKNILMIAQGTEGIAAIRSALEWTPVQAHATEHHVALVYLCKNRGSAAYLKDWDVWREAGITVKPVYFAEELEGVVIAPEAAVDKLAFTIYNDDNGLAGTIGGRPADCTVLMAGMNGDVTRALSRRLIADGVSRDQIWGF